MIRVYLAGKVAKGDEIGKIEDWRIRYKEELNECTKEDLFFMDPDNPELDESDSMEIVGHDCNLIKTCDLIIVNAETKLGVGTAQEMLIAKHFKKCVVSVIPENSHYCRKNMNMYGNIIEKWTHPFMDTISDIIFNSVHELVLDFDIIIEKISKGNIKDITIIDKACDYYCNKKGVK